MTTTELETILNEAAAILNADVRKNNKYRSPNGFQERAKEVLQSVAQKHGFTSGATFHPSAFPDLKANGFGIEVKTVQQDTWISTGNSVFETMRDPTTKEIYVLFGKMGGTPEVRWGKYDECVVHVRISHAPRFMVDMERNSGQSLFEKIGVPYNDFYTLPADKKMSHIRKYSRERLKPGERLWWIEDESGPGMPLEVKLYMNLTQAEKVKLRAEGAALFPRIYSSSREKGKYEDVAFYFLKRHSVFCPQTRDLFTAGSVAGKERGGNYALKALKNIESVLRDTLLSLDGALIEEYWGKKVAPKDRIKEWLSRADSYAKGWKPSEHLFLPSKK